MVEISDLKKMNFMKDMPEDVLDKVAAVAQMADVGNETILIRQGDIQDRIYMLVSGSICINSRATSGKTLTLEELVPGQSFGLSALLENTPSSYTAICDDDCQIISVSSDQLRQVFESDYIVGYQFMEKVVEKFKLRMGRQSKRFMAALATHPDIG